MNKSETHIVCEVERIVHRNADDDWSVIRVTRPDVPAGHFVVGYSSCQPGQGIEVDGAWHNKPPYGDEFMATKIVASSPTTLSGLVSYLGSGILPGVGPKIAGLMVNHFGDKLPSVLDAAPERVREIRGIGPAKAARVVSGWKQQAAVRGIMLFLHSQGLAASLCRRIYKALGDDAVNAIKTNPYRLCTEVRGIGFKTADAVARELAIPHASEQRVLAGIAYQLGEMTSIGNCGCERGRFSAACSKLLDVPPARVGDVLDVMLNADAEHAELVAHDGAIYPVRLARAEESIADVLCKRAARTPGYACHVDAKLVSWAAERCGMRLAPKQDAAVWAGLTRSVSVITGGPGCGKTATLNVLLAAYHRLGLSVALVAPTGKAAQRAHEATGVRASTIHRLLARHEGSDEGIDASVLVIDETSMVDVPLMARVVDALDPRTTLVLVGDVDQLPSVGPGQVLSDIIGSGAVPVTVLDQVFRQAAGSAIITNAHAINRGELPESAGSRGDFFVLTERNTGAIAHAMESAEPDRPAAVATAVAGEIETLVAERLPRAYRFDPVRDVQVLAPMNKGACGVFEMNRRLQARLNPNPAQYVNHHGVRFGVGDKVIQRRNNYALDIFNGDVGFVDSVGTTDAVLNIHFDRGIVGVPFDDLIDVSLAYALTIHKSQGSQAPAVIVPLVSQHQIMLQRNLLYTGVTRASKLAIVIGQHASLAVAVRTVSSTRRVTRLKQLLLDSAPEVEPTPSARPRSRPPTTATLEDYAS